MLMTMMMFWRMKEVSLLEILIVMEMRTLWVVQLMPKMCPSRMHSALKLKDPQAKFDPPFPQRLKKKEDETKFHKFLSMFNYLSIKISMVEDLTEMSSNAKLMKELV